MSAAFPGCAGNSKQHESSARASSASGNDSVAGNGAVTAPAAAAGQSASGTSGEGGGPRSVAGRAGSNDGAQGGMAGQSDVTTGGRAGNASSGAGGSGGGGRAAAGNGGQETTNAAGLGGGPRVCSWSVTCTGDVPSGVGLFGSPPFGKSCSDEGDYCSGLYQPDQTNCIPWAGICCDGTWLNLTGSNGVPGTPSCPGSETGGQGGA